MRVIGEMLAAHGYTSKGILLPGHGTQPEDLMEVTYKDWINAAQAGINELKKTCQKIVVIGHSMGGLLALQMAARNKVDGVVTIAAAIKPSNRKAHLAWLFKHFKPFVAGANKERPAEQRKYLLHYPLFPCGLRRRADAVGCPHPLYPAPNHRVRSDHPNPGRSNGTAGKRPDHPQDNLLTPQRVSLARGGNP